MKISNIKLRAVIAEQISNILKHPLFSGSAIMVIGSNATNFLNYIYHLIMGRLLGPANYGELAALISLMGLLSILPGSINLVIIKYVSSAKNETDVISLISWLKARIVKVSLMLTFVILITSPLIASFLHINKFIYLILIAVSFLFGFQSLFYRAILQGLLKFKEMILSVLVENTSKLLISVFLIYLGFRVGGAMLAFVIAAFLGWYITTYYLKFRTKQKTYVSPDVKSMALFAVPVIIQSFSQASLYSSDVILVKHFFTSYDAGIYASLSTLGKIIFFGTGPIGAVMFPIVSQRKAKGGNYRKIFIYSLFSTSFLAASLLMIYWLFPNLAIRLLYGSAYLEGSNLLVWFGIFITLFTIAFLFISYALSLGKTKVVLLPFIAAISQIILIWFFHESLFRVIAISIVISALLLLGLLIYSSLWKMDLRRSD